MGSLEQVAGKYLEQLEAAGAAEGAPSTLPDAEPKDWEASAAHSSRKRPTEGDLEREDAKRERTNALDSIFRLLIPGSRAGSLIGKGGTIIKLLRESTGSKVRITDHVQNCPERVVVVHSEDYEPSGTTCPAKDAVLRIFDLVRARDFRLSASPRTTFFSCSRGDAHTHYLTYIS